MESLLFITPELPYPPHSGGKIKSFKLLNALAERYDVTLACPLKGDDRDHVDAFHAVSPCVDHVHEPLDVPRSATRLLRSYLHGRPLNVERTLSKPLQGKVHALAPGFDVLFLDHYEVYPYLPAHCRGLRVYHAHNAYHKLWARFAGQPGNPLHRAAAWLESKRVRRRESAVAAQSGLVFAAPNDAGELIRAGVDPASVRNTFHLGDDRQLDLPELRFENTEKRLMYVGTLGWEANAQGLLWFMDSVWPLLRKRYPDLEFDIVGKGEDQRLRDAVRRSDGVELLGFVPSLEEIYQRSRVSVAPLLFGSGMKVKVLDSMARGMPTVTTSVGAEGIDIDPGQQLLVADDAISMTEQVGNLLTDPELWNQVRAQSRDLIRQKYTWNRLFHEMHADLGTALYQHQAYENAPDHPEMLHVS